MLTIEAKKITRNKNTNMAFKMKYKKGGFPFKNDDEKKVVDNEEFVNDGSKQPGVTQELHDALTASLTQGGKEGMSEKNFLKDSTNENNIVKEKEFVQPNYRTNKKRL